MLPLPVVDPLSGWLVKQLDKGHPAAVILGYLMGITVFGMAGWLIYLAQWLPNKEVQLAWVLMTVAGALIGAVLAARTFPRHSEGPASAADAEK